MSRLSDPFFGKKRKKGKRGRGRELPGQGEGRIEELGFDITARAAGHLIITRALLLLGDPGRGNYAQLDVDGVKLFKGGALGQDLQAGGDVFIGEDTSLPDKTYLSIFAAGQNYNGELVQAGDLLIGDNTAGKANVFYDKSAGALLLRRGKTDSIALETDGDVFLGEDVSQPNKTFFSVFAAAQTYNGEAMGVGNLLIGSNSATKNNLLWDDANGRFVLRRGTTEMLAANAINGGFRLGSDVSTAAGHYLLIQGTDGTHNGESIQAGDLLIGDNSAGKGNVFYDKSAGWLSVRQGTAPVLQVRNNGTLMLGSDISSPGTRYLGIYAAGETPGGETMGDGDMIIGDNSSSKANIFWDKSAARLNFRGGQTTQAYIDTDGTIVAGAGDVKLNATGLRLNAALSGGTKRIAWVDGTPILLEIYAGEDAGVEAYSAVIARGKNATTHEAHMELIAITDDGSAHAGAASVTMDLETANDRITANAKEFRVQGQVLKLTAITTTQRNALTAADGMIVYNSTTSQFEGRAGGSWVAL